MVPSANISQLAEQVVRQALAVLAAGTCATYGGIHAMAGNPTGAMGVPDYLGWSWKSKAYAAACALHFIDQALKEVRAGVMRTVRSFDPCLPCGVHMYLGGG